MKKNKGFTLIELLVVIAIIGILASVVLASLSNARAKGKDASVKSQLASMKAQGELYLSSSADESYVDICKTEGKDNGLKDLLIAAKNSSEVASGITGATVTTGTPDTYAFDQTNPFSSIGQWDKVTCHEDGVAWAVDAPLSTSTSSSAVKMYCVDSTGASLEKNAVLGAGENQCVIVTP